MLDKVQFSIAGSPQRKQRPQIMARCQKVDGKVRAIVQAVTPPETKEAEKVIADRARRAMGNKRLMTSAVRITVIAIFPIPPSWPRRVKEAAAAGKLFHTSTPDTDNILKLASDAMNGIVYVDDSQAAETVTRKRFGSRGETIIIVEELPQPILTPADERRAKDQAAGKHRAQTHAPASKVPEIATVQDASGDLFA